MFLCPLPSRVPVVTEEVAREALLSFVNSQCCYSSAAAGDFIIQELRQQTLCRVGRTWASGHTGKGALVLGVYAREHVICPHCSSHCSVVSSVWSQHQRSEEAETLDQLITIDVMVPGLKVRLTGLKSGPPCTLSRGTG